MSKTPKLWLIWSFEHNAWWREGGHGYTPHQWQAGTYTLKEATRIITDANIEMRAGRFPHEAILPLIERDLGKDSFQCFGCGNVYKYDPAWPDEAARQEAAHYFGKRPEKWKVKAAQVCGDCYQKMHPANHPDFINQAKKEI